MKITALDPGTYIVAVSGGVDSMVLLDLLVKANFQDVTYIVAHVDHGIRADSREDRFLVEKTAGAYRLKFEFIDLLLDEDASENKARIARHAFLKDLKQKYGAKAIMTAHHKNDVIETAIINIWRGTGWRGIASLRDTADYRRPLIGYTKTELYSHAHTYHINWREDSTNSNLKYFRNFVRNKLLPLIEKDDPQFIESFYGLVQKQVVLRLQLENAIQEFSKEVIWGEGLNLGEYKKIDVDVALEIMRWFMRSKSIFLTRPQLDRLCLFALEAHRNQKHSLGAGVFACRRGSLLVVERG